MTSQRFTIRSAESLGQALARVRTDQGLTQDEIADRLGITRRYVYEIESGKPNLFATRLFELIRELNGHLELHTSTDEDSA